MLNTASAKVWPEIRVLRWNMSQLWWMIPPGIPVRIRDCSTFRDLERSLAEDIEYFTNNSLVYTLDIPLEFYIQMEEMLAKVKGEERWL